MHGGDRITYDPGLWSKDTCFFFVTDLLSMTSSVMGVLSLWFLWRVAKLRFPPALFWPAGKARPTRRWDVQKVLRFAVAKRAFAGQNRKELTIPGRFFKLNRINTTSSCHFRRWDLQKLQGALAKRVFASDTRKTDSWFRYVFGRSDAQKANGALARSALGSENQHKLQVLDRFTIF